MAKKKRKRGAGCETEAAAPRTAAELAKLLREAPECVDGGLRERERLVNVQVIPTGIATLDAIIANGRVGKGGVPLGRFIVYSGAEGGGKTTAALVTAAAFQKAGGIVIYIDAERKLDIAWAAKAGVNMDDVIMSYPKTLEDVFEVIEMGARKKDPSVPLLVVLDSVNAGATREEKEAAYGARLYAPQQRVLSQAFARICDYLESGNTTLLMISQLRSKMDASVTIAGGNAVRFYSILIVTFDGVTKVAAGEKSLSDLYKEARHSGKRVNVPIVAAESRISTIKNQIGGPFAESKIRINFKRGLDFEWCTHYQGIQVGIIKQSGSWFSFGGRSWQGFNGFRKTIAKRPKFLANLVRAIQKAKVESEG